jgi:hypothetical protein
VTGDRPPSVGRPSWVEDADVPGTPIGPWPGARARLEADQERFERALARPDLTDPSHLAALAGRDPHEEIR